MSSTFPSSFQARLPLSPGAAKYVITALFLLAAGVGFGSRVLLSSNFLPHWYCYVGNKPLLWTHAISDFAIGLSYVAISATLVWLVRHPGRELPFPYFFWAFGLFIVSCGSVHFLEVLTVWKPVYWLSAAAKVVTAVFSVVTALVLVASADEIAEFVRTARDAAARRGNEQFRALINAAPMAVISTDLNGKITAWNPTAERLFGWPAGHSLGEISSFVPPEKRQEQAELFRKTLEGAVTSGLETVRFNHSGCRIPVSVSVAPLRNEAGAVTAVLGVLEDISERKRIERELLEKTSVLSTVTLALNDYLENGDWSAASRHLLSFAIQKTDSAYGFLGVILEGPVLRVLAYDGIQWDPHINREFYEEKIRQYQTQGYFEVEHKNNLLGEIISKGINIVANSPGTDPRSGGLFPGHPPLDSFLGVPIFKGSELVGLIAVANRPSGYTDREAQYLLTLSQATGVLYDSYRQNLKRNTLEEEQRLLETQMRQAQKMEVLGRLAGGVAHDFNNMLMVVAGCSELLDRSLPGDSPARLHLDQIQRTTEKAAAITKQLLAFSRKQVFQIRPIDLHEALTNSEFMLPRLLGTDIELTFHSDAAHSWIQSDPAQIEQIVANLAINARDAMPGGGQLAISTRNAPHLPGESAESSSEPAKWVVLEVRDTGHGMDEKTRSQIFEPFFTTKPPGKGTGLGLATVYGIVKQSGGHIHVHSALDEGARFEIYFPIADAPAPLVEKESPAQSSADAGGATILVTDDEVPLRQAIAEILRSSGYHVLEASTATEALETVCKHPGELDVLLTDIVMPGLRGPELARRVATTHPHLKVIYMSGYPGEFQDEPLPPNSAFLQKPFRFATLLEQLKLLRRKN